MFGQASQGVVGMERLNGLAVPQKSRGSDQKVGATVDTSVDTQPDGVEVAAAAALTRGRPGEPENQGPVANAGGVGLGPAGDGPHHVAADAHTLERDGLIVATG